MTHSKFWRTPLLNFVSLILTALLGLATATAQTTVPLTPAQQKAEAAREARQAAQQQAAQKRAAAAQARTAAKTNPAATAPAAGTAATTATKSTTAAPNTTAGTTGANAATPPATASKSTGAVGSGTLAWQTRVYRSTGCVHNGNTAECTFTFANQGNEATLLAASEMAGLQLVDDAHVPHHGVNPHFLDKYGTQQPRLVVQPGDSGTYVVSFPDVNSQVTTADFHLRQQIVGGVTFSSDASGTKSETAGTSAPAKTTK